MMESADPVPHMDSEQPTESEMSTADADQKADSECKNEVDDGSKDNEDVSTPAPVDGADAVDDNDEYAYIQRGGFTSEIFKIEIKNLTNKISPTMLKKFVASKNLHPKKVKLLKMNFEVKAYVAFSCEADRERAVKEINGCQWKGCHLLAKPALPKADPLQMKKKLDQEDSEEPAPKRAKTDTDDDIDPVTKLKNSVTPLWNVPYEDQLKQKHENMKEFIRKLGRQIDRNNQPLLRWFIKSKKANQGLCCPLDPIHPSPVREGYRNKCEFTIGHSLTGTGHVVGFRYGKYRGGCSSVGEPDQCKNVPETMLRLVRHMSNYISTAAGQYSEVFNPELQRGHWRLLTVRTTVNGSTMAMIDFHPQQLTQDQIDEVKTSLAKYFTENARNDVTSLYFHVNREKTTGANDVTPYELILGERTITETLSGLSFSISPLAFFQVNTPGAEVLYGEVKRMCCELSGAGKQTTVLDVCCGTGTIGLTMARDVKRVIGVEMVQSAVEDAKNNAVANKIENAEYKCGKAEDVMPDLMTKLVSTTDENDHVVAVVDPPRAGLHNKVVQTLRRCEELKTLVYVSCNPQGAFNNMLDLCRAESKRVRGSPFVPVRAACVDLFPDTPHCELVILFERYDARRHLIDKPAEDQGQGQTDNGGQGPIEGQGQEVENKAEQNQSAPVNPPAMCVDNDQTPESDKTN